MDNWIKVEDKMPEALAEVITWNGKEVAQGYRRQDNRWNTLYSEGFGSFRQDVQVSHWMPLPDPPSGN